MEVIEYYHKDDLCSKIYVDAKTEKVKVVNFTDFILDKAFGVIESPTYKDYEEFLEYRCFPKTRYNCRELLDALDIDFYNPYAICRKTHGIMFGDFYWLKFEGDTTTWEFVQDWLNA